MMRINGGIHHVVVGVGSGSTKDLYEIFVTVIEVIDTLMSFKMTSQEGETS